MSTNFLQQIIIINEVLDYVIVMILICFLPQGELFTQ